MRIILSLVVLSILVLFLTNTSAYAQAVQVERIRFTEYGIYTVDRDVQGRDALGINRAAASNVRHAVTLRTIPAQIGTTFGFRYKVIGGAHGALVELKQIVIFPPPGLFPSPSSKWIKQDQFVLQTRIGETGYVSYTMEDAFELVPGIWTFEIWQGDRKLATQAFKVITLSPDDQKLIRPAADANMSAPTASCEECNGL